MTSNVELLRAKLEEGWVTPIAKLLGFRQTEIAVDRARIEFDAGPQHANPMGSLHGGVLCDIADAAMDMAFASGLTADETFTTLELKVNFLRPFWTGRLVAEGRTVKRGRRVGLLDCRITDEEEELVAYATSTCITVPGARRNGPMTHVRHEDT